MADVSRTLADYEAAWNEADAERRAALLEACCAETASYTAPNVAAPTRDALSEEIGQLHAALPGASLQVVTGLDAHHDRVRFQWRLYDGSGAQQGEGTSFGMIGADGSIESISAFFGPFPPKPA